MRWRKNILKPIKATVNNTVIITQIITIKKVRRFKLEKTIFISTLQGIKYLNNGYSRIYFGNEFCQQLIPGKKDLKEIIRIAKKRGKGFTLVTPYVTNEGLTKLRGLFDLLKKQRECCEVVVNDWGVLRLLNKEYDRLQPILGRLLHKLKRGPEITNVMRKLPLPAAQHFKDSNVSLIWYRRFLFRNRIQRVEFDNLAQGIETAIGSGMCPMQGSLYIPYVYVTTTRICLVNGCDAEVKTDKVGIFPCGKECQKYTFYLTNSDIPVKLILKGNTQFFINEKIPRNLKSNGINRIVEQPEIPI